MSRNGSALVWFIAFPFTLINMAYEMRPAGGFRRCVHVTVVTGASLVLTAATTCWAIAIVETGLLLVNLPSSIDRWRPLGAVVIVTAALIAILLFRPLVERESRWHAVSALLHTAVVTAVGAVGYFVRPSEWMAPDSRVHWPFSLDSPAGNQLELLQLINAEFDWSNDPERFNRWLAKYDALDWQTYFDPVGTVGAAALILMVCGAAILACTARRRHPGAAGGAALALIAAIALTTLTTSCILGVLLPRVESQSSRNHKSGQWAILGEDDLIQPYTVWLGRGHRVSDSAVLLPGLSLMLLTGLTLAFITAVVVLRLRLRYQGHWVPASLTDEARKLARVHLTAQRIGPVLWWTSVLAVAACIACLALFTWYAEKTQWCPSTMSGTQCDAITMNGGQAGITASGIVAVIIFFVIRRINTTPAFKAKLEAVADIAGFWPITVQPFGARSYRPYAVDGIADAVLAAPERRKTLLVGHSQGSVLAAWTVATRPDIESRHMRELILVTCGSPLRSLYAAFFPRWFDEEWFTSTRSRVAEWRNFWRETDPIAIPLQHNGITDVCIPDPDPEYPDTLRGHGDYWIATAQKAFVETHTDPM
jgi:hypothetical protein